MLIWFSFILPINIGLYLFSWWSIIPIVFLLLLFGFKFIETYLPYKIFIRFKQNIFTQTVNVIRTHTIIVLCYYKIIIIMMMIIMKKIDIQQTKTLQYFFSFLEIEYLWNAKFTNVTEKKLLLYWVMIDSHKFHRICIVLCIKILFANSIFNNEIKQ